MKKSFPLRCGCGCEHVWSEGIIDGVLKINFRKCECSDIPEESRTLFDTNYHWIIHEKKTKFIPYKEYINSDEWRLRSFRAKIRAKFKCQVCNKPYEKELLDTHHRTYERLGCEKNEDLIVLCRTCHTLFESSKRQNNDR
jgi:5-methylcytosine-specific restriction endonuclease McrA